MTVTHLAGHLIRPRPGAGVIDWAIASGSLPENVEPGSRAVIRSVTHGVLVAVVDGLGRRSDAAVAAGNAAATLEGFAEAPLRLLVRRCHEELSGTRGAAITVARFDARSNTMEWLAVGNVEGVLARAGTGGDWTWEHVSLRGGVVGYRLPPMRTQTASVGPGDTLVLATDGISSDFAGQLDWSNEAQQVAEDLLTWHGSDTDDALALVARYLGVRP